MSAFGWPRGAHWSTSACGCGMSASGRPRGDHWSTSAFGCGMSASGRPRGAHAASRASRSSSYCWPSAGWGGEGGLRLMGLLLAIGVVALLTVLSWRGLDGMGRAQETTRQRADEMLVLQAALGQWGSDLDALLPMGHTTAPDCDAHILPMTPHSKTLPH